MKSTKSGSCTATIGASPRSGGSTIVAPAATEPVVQHVAALRLLVARLPHAEPVAAVRRVAAMALATRRPASATPSRSPNLRSAPAGHATLTGMPPPQPRPRARELGLTFGTLATGEHNAITDVPGVRVGQVTVWRDEPDGSVARTGCTVVAPGRHRAAVAQPDGSRRQRCSTAPAS